MSTALLVMWMWAAQGNQTEVPSANEPQIICNYCKGEAELRCDPPKRWIYHDGIGRQCELPVDVPAVQEHQAVNCPQSNWTECSQTYWTCSDKSRVLLTSEDGKRHCIKFGVR